MSVKTVGSLVRYLKGSLIRVVERNILNIHSWNDRVLAMCRKPIKDIPPACALDVLMPARYFKSKLLSPNRPHYAMPSDLFSPTN